MDHSRQPYGWAGTVRDFLNQPASLIENQLEIHLQGLFGFNASQSQVEAWIEEIEILRRSLRDLAIANPDSIFWSIIFEFELPLEGGRRPDVIILGPKKIFVMEFKQDFQILRSNLDQISAYARDLAEYHSASHGITVIPLLILTKSNEMSEIRDQIQVLSPDRIGSILDVFRGPEKLDLETWLAGDYAPLPTLIAAAKMIFKNERLPAIKRAQSSGVNNAVIKLKEIANSTKENQGRSLAFVSGVPGAGKTLVGLQFVYDQSTQESQAIFLSGNGPLVEVLRDALQSKAFVSDLHAFIKSYGTTSKVPNKHIIVFDEAQRAWDSSNMLVKKGVNASEPDLLLQIGEKISNWTCLVGLIGHGQEIHTGEEAGIEGWKQALNPKNAKKSWKVFTPPRFTGNFDGLETVECPELDLNVSLRSKQAEQLHNWVHNLLEGNLSEASKISTSIWNQNFPILLTRDLDIAKQYILSRFENELSKRFGIIASSKDRVLSKFGINNGFQDTRRVKNSSWFNNERGKLGSGCNFEEVVTEFGCQGLELDLAIVAWGNDFLWTGNSWEIRKMRTRTPQRDPHQLRLNSYRVLLTRSREGLVIFVPPLEEFNKTEHALLASGARYLENEKTLAEIS